MSNVVGRRYRYGAGFVDRLSGVRFEGHHPLLRPDLWRLYLTEAEGIYRDHGFEGTLRRRDLDEGNGVTLFFLGFAPDGKVVAGVRCHGPVEGSHQTAIVEEMSSSPEIDQIAGLIDEHAPRGVIEIKGAFSKGENVTGYRLVATISRAVTHAMQWMGAELAIAAVSDTLLPTGNDTGARQVGSQSVPFPDERYRTVAVEWRRARSHERCSPPHQLDLRLEAEQLSRRQPVAGARGAGNAAAMPWRPLLLDVRTRAHREVLQVLREDPTLQVLDRYPEQRRELDALRPPVPSGLLEEGQRWVFFPWRRAVVRLLAPRSFSALRLDRNRNKLTREEQSHQRSLRVGIVGLSAGHSIAHALAMEGLAGELRLADFDDVELSNLNRLPGTVLDLGVNKAITAARRIAEIDPYLRVTVVPEGIRKDNLAAFLDGLDLVVEECDSLDVKLLIREAARDQRMPVVMATSDRGVLDVERFDQEPERPVFHGLLPGVHSSDLAELTIEQKAPYVLRMMGAADVSARGAASLFEVGRTITAWPQLASEVTLGAATVAAVVRRLGQRGHLPSGRVRIDLDDEIDGLAPVELPEPMAEPAARDPVADLPDDADEVDRIVNAARRAPSGGNIQPWRFEADDGEIRFYLVPERTTAMDVRFRASYVGIGAALFNARVAAAAERRLGTVKLFPEGYPSRHVATLRLGDASDFEVAPLHARIHTRAANRRVGTPTSIAPSTLQLLTRGVEREGAQLRMVTGRAELDRLGELLAESDRIRFLTPTLHREMMAELRVPGRDPIDEGIDVRTLELGPSELASLDLLRRPEVMAHLAEWRAGHALGLRTRASVALSSAMAAIVVPRADPMSYVRGGAAVERFWLTAEVHGLAVHPTSPVFLFAVDTEERLGLVGERNLDALTELSQRFEELFGLGGGEHVALLLRVSHAARPDVHSERLPLTHLLSRQREPTSAMAVVQPWQNGASAGLGELRN
jgi:molybdopterin/thiamine biosynthesis adenylyltransferase/nitroreductase